MTISKQDGDQIGATVTFEYKGPTIGLNVGVIVETKPYEIYLMKAYTCQGSNDWMPHSVTVSGVYSAPHLDHYDLITTWKVIYPAGASPQPNGDGSLFKDGDQAVYRHVSEAQFQRLYATYT